jgi:hypothetical protein
LLLIFLLGLRFVTPYSTNARMVQHTIQLVPRLPEPTLVTKVWAKNNMPVKKGDKLFEFDRRPYQYKVDGVKAQLAEAKQNVLELKAKMDAMVSATAEAKAQQLSQKAAYESATAQLADAQADQEQARVNYEQVAAEAIKVAQANEEQARLAYASQINGENTTVAQLEANLAEAQYYLDNTTIVAPEDGMIINLQVQPGMVSGVLRVGAIAVKVSSSRRGRVICSHCLVCFSSAEFASGSRAVPASPAYRDLRDHFGTDPITLESPSCQDVARPIAVRRPEFELPMGGIGLGEQSWIGKKPDATSIGSTRGSTGRTPWISHTARS